jgi:hypothetical protein
MTSSEVEGHDVMVGHTGADKFVFVAGDTVAANLDQIIDLTRAEGDATRLMCQRPSRARSHLRRLPLAALRKPQVITLRAYQPCIPTPQNGPAGEQWLHEIKHDGYRLMVVGMASACGFTPSAAMIGRSDTRSSWKA